MPSQVQANVENNFTKGLITEATGLNFPENAATAASNCIFTLIGDVVRREGINFEANGTTTNINRANMGMATYVWNNPGGDGNSKLLAKQVGSTLYFYNIATATTASPISTQLLGTTISISAFTATGSTFDATKEVTFADGNGYLFVYHPSIDPVVITYNPVTLIPSANSIQVQTRDFQGLNDGLASNFRPPSLSNEHQYNLANQGWTTAASWTATGTASGTATVGQNSNFNVQSGLTIANGTVVAVTGFLFPYQANIGTGTVVNYVGTVLTINWVTFNGNPNLGAYGNFLLSPTSVGFINTWHTAEGNYPSNSDIWWLFKDSTGAFNPATTQANISFSLGLAPKGHFVTSAWNIDRSAASALSNITPVTTTSRPTNGAWYSGRVWFTGLNASVPATGDASAYTWTENIYFSQVIQDPTQFGNCYQTNDPTSQNLNGLLPTDGGVINLVGSGTIYKLFPIANGMLVFANNGVWFITGSQGIGFAANDYTITKISSVKSLSNKTFVDVLGLPYFWNEEGIYQCMQSGNGQLAVEPITVGTILTFYNNIPLASKLYARGSYNPIDYLIEWSYRSTPETSTTDRYQHDSVLNYNTFNKAFYPYTINTNGLTQFIHAVHYISFPVRNPTTPMPGFWYPASQLSGGNYMHGLAQEYDTTFVDWGSVNYKSTFTTGFKLHGQAWRKFQTPYVYVYSRNNNVYSAYFIQGAWDYGSTFDSNRWTTPQFTEINDVNASMVERRHKIRGKGYVLQLMFTSVDGQPFDLMGWATYENVNQGV